MQSIAMPRIMNDISTAKLILRDMKNQDVGIPQLTILSTAAFQIGDLVSAKEFVTRAVSKNDDNPYLRSEAKRYEGKYFFLAGKPAEGRQSFNEALTILGNAQGGVASQAYDLQDLILSEFSAGNCDNISADLNKLSSLVRTLPNQTRGQLAATMTDQLAQIGGQRCPLPTNIQSIFAG